MFFSEGRVNGRVVRIVVVNFFIDYLGARIVGELQSKFPLSRCWLSGRHEGKKNLWIFIHEVSVFL